MIKMKRVYVKGLDGEFCVCEPTPRGYKCGVCLRGVIGPVKGYLCKVCGSRVAQVLDENEYAIPVKWVDD